VQAAISKAKNQLLTPEKYAGQAVDFFAQTVARVYPVYEKKLRDANAFDFDDLLYWPALALRNDAELRAELDERFRFVLIDEYQDTNQAQYAIARGLSVDYPNLCCVGDIDQSIYGWRGADIRNIKNFERDFPDCRVINLDRNYRSTATILRAVAHLINHGRARKREFIADRSGPEERVRVLTCETGYDEAEQVAARIKAAVEAGRRRYRDFAVFLRINALSRTLEQAFLKLGVPYQIVRGLAFFERKENRDVLAYLRLLVNPRDDLSFLRAVGEPARGIGKVSLEHLRAFAEPRELSLLEAARDVGHIPAIKGKAATGLREFARLIDELSAFRDAAPEEVIRLVLDRSGYRQMLAGSADEEDLERLANIEELITAARQFATDAPDATVAAFLENVTLASDVDGWDERQDCVSVMTLHAAKGLEFPVVYLMAVEQGLLPHERSLQREEELEEERRLAFVGMTRAMEELYLTHARLRDFRGISRYTIPSMFLEVLRELPGNVIEFADVSASAASYRDRAAQAWRGGGPAAAAGWHDAGVSPAGHSASSGDPFAEGMLVRHDTYGTGHVTEVSGFGALRKVKVRFRTAGERTFLADKARLTVVPRG
jgi:DNA helicase-2/ATP-dependent DNA helicase PcrA